MTRQSAHVRLMAERNPQDPAAALDTEIAADLVGLADSLRNGRKASGVLVRFNKLAAGTTTPRPSDFIHLAAAGVDPADLVLILEKMIVAVKRAAPAVRLSPATLVREVSEAGAAVVDYATQGTPELRQVARREVEQAERVLEQWGEALRDDEAFAVEARFRALHALRTPAPRAD